MRKEHEYEGRKGDEEGGERAPPTPPPRDLGQKIIWATLYIQTIWKRMGIILHPFIMLRGKVESFLTECPRQQCCHVLDEVEAEVASRHE